MLESPFQRSHLRNFKDIQNFNQTTKVGACPAIRKFRNWSTSTVLLKSFEFLTFLHKSNLKYDLFSRQVLKLEKVNSIKSLCFCYFTEAQNTSKSRDSSNISMYFMKTKQLHCSNCNFYSSPVMCSHFPRNLRRYLSLSWDFPCLLILNS